MKLGHIVKYYYVFFKFDNGEYPTMPSRGIALIHQTIVIFAGLFPAILGKDPWPKLGKNDQLNIKIGRN